MSSNVEYPEGITAFNELALKNITAYKDENDTAQDMNIHATGDLNLTCDSVIGLGGDLVLNSNLVLNGTTYMNDANFYRVFDDDFTISYGFQINDNGILQLYKHDSRVNNSTVVMSFGSGNISSTARSAGETATSKIDTIMSKSSANALNIFGNSLTRRNQ